ncbi:hypothetical protein R3P38DRAFT_3194854 [Favolaschia claudopus]|uniref:JmjC domain-containing protein n=1 Tax=Favolaschia claudopus TaxID=2862362 RepID=A0AAW0BFQ8_9AGAR
MEVQSVLPNPNLQGIPATLAVAIAVSPIYLLSGQNYAQSTYNPGTSIYHMWLASGNAHIIDLAHPLGNLDRLFWRILPRVSCGQLSARDAVALIFASPEMKTALEGEHSPAILVRSVFYVSDEQLETLTEPEDVETERQMANYLEITRKHVQEQEARLAYDRSTHQSSGGYSFGGTSYFTRHYSGGGSPSKSQPSSSLDSDKQPLSPETLTSREKVKRKNQAIYRAYMGFRVLRLRSVKREKVKRKNQAIYRAYMGFRVLRLRSLKRAQKPKPVDDPNKEHDSNDKKEDSKDDESRKRKGKSHARQAKKPSSSAKAAKVEFVVTEKPRACYVVLDNNIRKLEPEQSVLQSARAFKWQAHRPVDPNPVKLSFYAPGTEPGIFVRANLQYTMFEKFKSDREMLAAMLESQPKGPDDLPLFLQNSARDPNPQLQASATQNTPASCVILVDVYTQDPSPPFDRTTMQEFRDPDALCSIQDMGLDGVRADKCVLAGPLSALLPDPDRPVLNAVHHPLPHHRLPTPPGLSTFCSLSPSLTFLEGHRYLPVVHSPWGDRQWALWATTMARTAIHKDIAGTEMTVVTGSKMIAIGCPRTEVFMATGYQADHGSRYAVRDWETVQETGRTDIYRWEIFLLRPNMVFYMPAGTPHFVISLQDTIAHGMHSINATQIQPTVFNVLHSFITEGTFANAEHRPIQSLLLRIYVVLYPAINLDAYPMMGPTNAVFGAATRMSPERFQEYMLALNYAVVLNRMIDALYVVGDSTTRTEHLGAHGIPRTFDQLCDISIVHMAVCLAQYRADWLGCSQSKKSDRTPNFTVATLKQQLRRSLCAYQSMWDHNSQELGDIPPITITLEPSVLSQRFDQSVQGPAITHFMPWDLFSRGMPYVIKEEKEEPLLDNKRPRSPGEDVPRKRARNED